MLKRLFTSKVRVKLLQVFMQNPEQEYFIRELTRVLDEQINSVRRELDNLKKTGLLTYKTKNRKKYYIVNKNFIIFNELKAIFTKANNGNAEFIEKLCKLGNIDFLLMAGIFINKEADTDLIIVGDLNKEELAKFLDANLTEPIKFSLFSKEDFVYRVKINDKFITSAIQNKENLISINKISKYLD